MNITLKPVESSQIHAIGHDPETSTMAIQFKAKGGPGSVYHYKNVTPEKFADFASAESIGKHFGEHFKRNADHPYTKIEAAE